MKKTLLFFTGLLILAISCKKNDLSLKAKNNDVPQYVYDRLSKENYSTYNVVAHDGGYIVEGDLFFPQEYFSDSSKAGWNNRVSKAGNIFVETLESSLPKPNTIMSNDKQGISEFNPADPIAHYRTNHYISKHGASVRGIWVNIYPGFPSVYEQALGEACQRYNNLDIGIHFSTVSTSNPQNAATPVDINIKMDNNLPSLGLSGGWPNRNGDFPAYPYNTISLNVNALGTNAAQSYLATVMAHEIGHMLGFRHTDYFNRAYSGCPYDSNLPGGYNEGTTRTGAVHIPGTPTTEDANSWMLACIGSGVNRPFTSNDVTALVTLFP
ncbi:hypothetical protein A8C56_11880 [Niabella ginsenosidivorans]|uniref:Dual-action HEIGH metallo-peptidase n=1 Tax=Niabella ginsenosidivorans TaxID=1176587 RepID=A0A1A9I4H7_9BACT|nr:M57 family metalloprotease [Niabella ginsenosidivorans]ANH81581.1 hypothetical protein A8C56_11880 [Niabella ginsenosidivorans]